jgi:hypothetical protein
MADCEHSGTWQFIDIEKVVHQKNTRLDDATSRLDFNIKAKGRCLQCGHITYASFNRSIVLEFSMNIVDPNSPTGDDGEGSRVTS